MTNLVNLLKSRDITLLTKVRIVKAMVFPVVMYRCDSWIIKKAEWQRRDIFELCCWRRLDRPLDCKEIKPVNPKRNQPWIFTGRTDAEAKAPIFRPPDKKSRLIEKDPGGKKEGRQKQKGTAEDEMVRQHYWLSGHEFEKILRDSGGQRSLGCCSQWGCKESDTT